MRRSHRHSGGGGAKGEHSSINLSVHSKHNRISSLKQARLRNQRRLFSCSWQQITVQSPPPHYLLRKNKCSWIKLNRINAKPDMKCPEAKILVTVEDVLSLAYLILNCAFKITTYVLTFHIAITKFHTPHARSSAKNNHGNFLYRL